MQNGTATLENILAVSYKVKCILTIQHSNPTPRYLPKWNENLYPHKNININVNFYNSIIHNCEKLETDKMPFKKWMDKLCCMHRMEHYSTIKRNELQSHIKTWMHLKSICYMKEGRQQKISYCIIPFTVICHLPMGICSENCVFGQFSRCVNIIECTHTNIDGIPCYTPGLYGTNLMGPPSYMWSVIDWNVVMWHMSVYGILEKANYSDSKGQ